MVNNYECVMRVYEYTPRRVRYDYHINCLRCFGGPAFCYFDLKTWALFLLRSRRWHVDGGVP